MKSSAFLHLLIHPHIYLAYYLQSKKALQGIISLKVMFLYKEVSFQELRACSCQKDNHSSKWRISIPSRGNFCTFLPPSFIYPVIYKQRG